MEIIRAPLSTPAPGAPAILLPVDRRTLAKRRWHAAAEDAREFGFDLAEPLEDGAPFFSDGGATYVISQLPEPVLEVTLTSPADSARLGWQIGNLHFSIEVAADIIRVPDDPALRQMFAREGIHFSAGSRVFHPASHAHVH